MRTQSKSTAIMGVFVGKKAFAFCPFTTQFLGGANNFAQAKCSEYTMHRGAARTDFVPPAWVVA